MNHSKMYPKVSAPNQKRQASGSRKEHCGDMQSRSLDPGWGVPSAPPFLMRGRGLSHRGSSG